MSFGFGFGFTKITAAIRAAFSPSSLFAANEPGVWYDPSDLSTLYQDAAGTTPVTAVEQPVGLMLDKSKGPVLGPELVTNGDFSNGTTGWALGTAWKIADGALVLSNSTIYRQNATNVGTVTIGKTYLVKIDVTSTTYAATTCYIGGVAYSIFTSGKQSFIATALNNSIYFRYIEDASGVRSATIKSISVRELPGNHAYQTTATSRPVLSARYNLLTKTEQFDDAVWVKTNVTVTPNAAVAPDGTVTADRVTTSATDGLVYLPTYATSYPQPITFSVCAKADASSSLTIQFISSGNGRGATFDLNAGTCTAVVAIGTGTGVSGGVSSIAALGGNWYRCTISNISVTDLRFPVFNVVGPSNSSIYIWGASLVPSNQADLPYQRVNTATDYDTAGFPHYLRFDGADDWLVTNTITPGTDKVQVFAGVRKLSDATRQHVIELSARYETNNGALAVVAPGPITTNSYGLLSGGAGGGGAAYATGFTAPITSVVSTSTVISTDTNILRVNGAQAASSTTNQGIGNYLAYPLYIGARAGTEYRFNGHIYSLIVRFGPNLPDATIEKTENYVNAKTRAY